MIEFAYPWLLLLLLLLPLIGVYCVYRQKQPSITVSTVAPFESVRAARRPGIPLTCMLLALGVTIVALARPRIGNEKFLMRSQGIDIVLAIDLSGSMAAYDVPPEIRSGRQLLNAIKDGANTARNRLTPEQAAELAKKFNVVIHTVGIGSDNAVGVFGGMIQRQEGSFDEKLLQELANITGGRYFRAADAEGMKQVMEEINRLEKTVVEQPKYTEYREFAPRLALVALALMAFAYLTQCTWRLRLP